MIKWVIKISKWMRISEWIILFDKNKQRLFSYIFVYQKQKKTYKYPSLNKLDAKAKHTATLIE